MGPDVPTNNRKTNKHWNRYESESIGEYYEWSDWENSSIGNQIKGNVFKRL